MSRASCVGFAPVVALLWVLTFSACIDDSKPLGPSVAPAVVGFEYLTYSKGMHPLGFSSRIVPLDNSTPGQGRWNTDLAFWGNLVFQGTYAGFRIVDASSAGSPMQLINYTDCQSSRGDVAVWNNILVRSWNSPATPTSTCGGDPVQAGLEGLHIFDVSNRATPVLLTFVALECGSRSATIVPDPTNDRLLVYSAGGSSNCPWLDIVQIPLAAPTTASFLRQEPLPISSGSCTDVSVILEPVLRLACATTGGFALWDIGNHPNPNQAGSLEDPSFLYPAEIPALGVAWSVTWTWDGKITVLGAADSGVEALCQTGDVVHRSIYFFDTVTGTLLGSFVLPRAQSALENCGWTRLSVVPTDRRYILVGSALQGGISVVDFTDPANAIEIAFADPEPLVNPDLPGSIEIGGDWAAYWYNGRIYESDMTRGLLIWTLSDAAIAGAKRLRHLNPQTQEPPRS